MVKKHGLLLCALSAALIIGTTLVVTAPGHTYTIAPTPALRSAPPLNSGAARASGSEQAAVAPMPAPTPSAAFLGPVPSSLRGFFVPAIFNPTPVPFDADTTETPVTTPMPDPTLMPAPEFTLTPEPMPAPDLTLTPELMPAPDLTPVPTPMPTPALTPTPFSGTIATPMPSKGVNGDASAQFIATEWPEITSEHAMWPDRLLQALIDSNIAMYAIPKGETTFIRGDLKRMDPLEFARFRLDADTLVMIKMDAISCQNRVFTLEAPDLTGRTYDQLTDALTSHLEARVLQSGSNLIQTIVVNGVNR